MRIAAVWAAAVALAAGPRVPAVTVIRADLDRDGVAERVVFDRPRPQTVEVWRGRRRLWAGVPRAWRPWKLAIADVDGDGHREIAIGIWKRTPFWPKPHNCLFVYRVTAEGVRRRWLGSRLSLPFRDFAFARLRPGRAEQLISIERRSDGRFRAVVYSWYGFGFQADRVVGPWRHARFLRAWPGGVMVRVDGRDVRIAGATGRRRRVR